MALNSLLSMLSRPACSYGQQAQHHQHSTLLIANLFTLRLVFSPASPNTEVMPDKSKTPHEIRVACDDLTAGSLRDHFLIAMPGLKDPSFARTVTYICEHNKEGAMGITINHPLELTVAEVFEQLKLPTNAVVGHQQVLSGGPVQTEQGYVLHPTGQIWDSTAEISSTISLTRSRDILEDMAVDKGPENSIVALGYAGWEAGQLEAEIAENSWLTIAADSDLLFHTPCEMRWTAAAQQLGINLDLISSSIGHS